jgi:hypothetical protein
MNGMGFLKNTIAGQSRPIQMNRMGFLKNTIVGQSYPIQ